MEDSNESDAESLQPRPTHAGGRCAARRAAGSAAWPPTTSPLISTQAPGGAVRRPSAQTRATKERSVHGLCRRASGGIQKDLSMTGRSALRALVYCPFR